METEEQQSQEVEEKEVGGQETDTQAALMGEGKLAMRVFFGDKHAIAIAAKNTRATLIGALILFVPFFLKMFLTFAVVGGWHPWHHPGLIIHMIGAMCAVFAPFYIARGYFGNTGDLEEYFRVVAYARFPHVITVLFAFVPALLTIGSLLDFLVDIWMLWVIHVVLMELFGMKEMDSFKTVGATFLLYIVLINILWLFVGLF